VDAAELGNLPLARTHEIALWDELAQATDNKQLEVTERIVYLHGRSNFKELSGWKKWGKK
jgi:hypothetical protein